jgi:hypothetical protein
VQHFRAVRVPGIGWRRGGGDAITEALGLHGRQRPLVAVPSVAWIPVEPSTSASENTQTFAGPDAAIATGVKPGGSDGIFRQDLPFHCKTKPRWPARPIAQACLLSCAVTPVMMVTAL